MVAPTSHFKDQPHVDRIASALWSHSPIGTAALLVGAGFSRNAVKTVASAPPMAGWNEVYRAMVDTLYPKSDGGLEPQRIKLLEQAGATSAYLRVAEEFESEFKRDALDQLIRKLVPDLEYAPGEMHRILLELPWADILTTNWDTLLERAADAVEDRAYMIVRTVEEIPETHSPRIIKLHGSLPAHRPFIFTEEDFRTYRTQFAPFLNVAQQLTMQNTLVLLGFSGDDPNFLYWSGWVRDRMGQHAPLIYLVGALDLSPSKRKMLERRQVQPIDLSQLPDYTSWPEAKRMENATRWFLEQLRASEPYRGGRWPRPPAGLDPPLRLVTRASNPYAPLELPASRQNDEPTVEYARRLIVVWRQHRSVYPGWIVAPRNARRRIWTQMEGHLHDVLNGLEQMLPEERLGALYEVNWRYETALIPILIYLDQPILATLEELVPRYGTLAPEAARQLRALAVAVVRHAREEGDEDAFARWTSWLEPLVQHEPEERQRLVYERCLEHLSQFQLDALEAEVAGWGVEGDPFWSVRKAGLLSDLGHETEAERVAKEALAEIRAGINKSADDLPSWSRESYAMLLRSAFMQGQFTTWAETKPVRERFDERQELLASRGCDGLGDFFNFIEELGHLPPPLVDPVERTPRFDIGAENATYHLGSQHPILKRLVALQGIRFQEETGLPTRAGNVSVAIQILQRAALWLMDVQPQRAFDTFLRHRNIASGNDLETIFSRRNVARIDIDHADRLFARLQRLAKAAMPRVEPGKPTRSFWIDRLKAAVEVLSRLVLRLPGRGTDAIALASLLSETPSLARQPVLGPEINNLIQRALEVLPAAERDEHIAQMFRRLPPDGGGAIEDAVDPVERIQLTPPQRVRSAEWSETIDILLNAAEDPVRRIPAIHRLIALALGEVLTETERRRFSHTLWRADQLQDGLPAQDRYYPQVFLKLPSPEGLDVAEKIKGSVLSAASLRNTDVTSGTLRAILECDAVQANEAELVDLLERLKAWATACPSPPAPDHPLSSMDSDSSMLASKVTALLSSLAARAVGMPAATALIVEIAALDKHPVHANAILPALVALGVHSPTEGAARMEVMLKSGDRPEVSIAFSALRQLLTLPGLPSAFTAPTWSVIAFSIVARRPAILVPLLHFSAQAYERIFAQIPTAIDPAMAFGLEIILAETCSGFHEPIAYDAPAARFFGAKLAVSMQRSGRATPGLRAAWQRAAQEDNLPDVRRALE